MKKENKHLYWKRTRPVKNSGVFWTLYIYRIHPCITHTSLTRFSASKVGCALLCATVQLCICGKGNQLFQLKSWVCQCVCVFKWDCSGGQGALGARPLSPRFIKNRAVFRQFWGKNPYFEQILGSGPPLGSKLRWAPLKKILSPRLDCGASLYLPSNVMTCGSPNDLHIASATSRSVMFIWSDTKVKLGNKGAYQRRSRMREQAASPNFLLGAAIVWK